MELVLKYFPDLTPLQKKQFEALYDLYLYWNERINVVSRKDIGNFYLHHVLHSLAIAKVCSFGKGVEVMDVGCGGGFPGIPLAIMFPDAHFTLIDSIGKKIKVVQEVIADTGLLNVTPVNGRAENVTGRFDYVVSRAVTEMKTFVGWVWNKIDIKEQGEGKLANGILYLKGGDLDEELSATGKPYAIYDINRFFEEDFFDTKKVVYIPR